MEGQMFVDLAGAFLILMLIAASGFAAVEKIGDDRAGAAAMCAGKNIVHSYADWLVKEGGAVSQRNADGGGYYMDHEMDLEKIGRLGGNFGIFVSYAGGKAQKGAPGISEGDYFCVKRIALCNKKICAVRVCGNGNV